jgi:hypothetical protein
MTTRWRELYASWQTKPLVIAIEGFIFSIGYDIPDVVGHVRLIEDAGLAEARFPSAVGNGAAVIIRLTNAGYDFLEASKQKTLWEKAKEKVKAAGVPVTVYTLQQVLDALIKAHLSHGS